jgi:hypothetical protein
MDVPSGPICVGADLITSDLSVGCPVFPVNASHCDSAYSVSILCRKLCFSLFLANMPPKKAHELTIEEFKLLVIAARLLAALYSWADRPRLPNEQAMWDIKVSEELVRPHYLLNGLSIS